MHLEDFDGKDHGLEIMDRWLLNKLHKMIKVCTETFDVYEYSKTKAETELFFWQVFCDNYLEIVSAVYSYQFGIMLEIKTPAKATKTITIKESTLFSTHFFANRSSRVSWN